MRLVPKPEGFELRDKRSDKSGDASDWTHQDCLYDASVQIAKADVDAVLVIYRERLKDGVSFTRFVRSGNRDSAPSLLMNALGRLMSWQD